ncbi:MAG: PAS domain S-box protein [Deltaproteobacteria bacterium]|nr:PAS domain S-box protein [Deltaproteobacteria bacterium]
MDKSDNHNPLKTTKDPWSCSPSDDDHSLSRKKIEKTIHFEKLIVEFASHLASLSISDFDQELYTWLERFAHFFEVDGIIILEISKDGKFFRLIQPYTRPGIELTHQTSDWTPFLGFQYPAMRENRAIVTRIPDDLPQWFPLNSRIIRDGAKSFVSVPLSFQDTTVGNVFFATFRYERTWSDDIVRRVSLIAEIIANFLFRRRAQTALEEEIGQRKLIENEYARILQIANIGFCVLDPDNNITEVNDEFCRMLGYSREELCSMNLAEIDTHHSPEELLHFKIEHSKREVSFHRIQTQHRCKDGSIIDLEISSTVGTKEDISFAFCRDITELRRARLELEDRLLFEELVSEFSAAIINIDTTDMRKSIGPWVEKLAQFLEVDRCDISEYIQDFSRIRILHSYSNPRLNITPKENEIRPTFGMYNYFKRDEIFKIDRIPDDFPEDVDQSVRNDLIRSGTRSMLSLPLKTGGLIFGVIVFSSYTTEKAWSKNIVRRLILLTEIISNAIMRDRLHRELTEYKQDLEKLVKKRTAELKEAQQILLKNERMAALGKLTAVVSHELRNPLGTIRASLYSIGQHQHPGNNRIEKALARADRSIKRCDNIIEELLNYARIQELEPEKISIDTWLQELLDEEPVPDGIRLDTELKSGETVNLDSERFRRCVINLLANAYQAVEKKDTKDAPGLVKIITRSDGSILELSIIDNGTGFGPEEQDKIFEPLYSTKSFGVGLGIPIAQKIVELHGGKLSIKGAPGMGAQVKIILPLSKNKRA